MNSTPTEACSRCAAVTRRAYYMRTPSGPVRTCLRCALEHPPMLRRSILTAFVVGTMLTAINQGTTLASGNVSWSLAWKVPLTYCVPFCVATWGALSNSRR